MKKITILIVFSIILFVSGAIFVGAVGNERLNVLVYGVDGRDNVENSERSDAIILVNLDLKKGSIVATYIQRESYFKITCKGDLYDKINHAYAYGVQKCLNETVSQLFDIENVYNVMLSFNDVVKLVDYFGLIKLTPQFTFCQSDENLVNRYCFEKDKEILIDGKQTLAYMRNRKSLPNGDLDRTNNQRQILKILVSKFLQLGLIEKINFYNYAKKNIKTDLNFTSFKIKDLIKAKQFQLSEYTLKGEDYIDKYYYYKLDPKYLEKIKKYYI